MRNIMIFGMLLLMCQATLASSKDQEFDRGVDALSLCSVSQKSCKEKYPDAEGLPVSSVAGYLYVTIDGSPYHLIAKEEQSLMLDSKYFSVVQVMELANLDKKAVVSPEVATYWLNNALSDLPEYRISSTQTGQILVSIMSDKPFNELLKSNADQGKRVSTHK